MMKKDQTLSTWSEVFWLLPFAYPRISNAQQINTEANYSWEPIPQKALLQEFGSLSHRDITVL